MEIYDILNKLKEKYPEDVEILESESEKVKSILKRKDFQLNETTQQLIKLCKKEILTARIKLASDKTLITDSKTIQDLWTLIESREWVIKFIDVDCDEVLKSLENELLVELNSL